MKQKLLKALSLAAIALCSVSTAWADRVAPTLPPAVEPQIDQSYYIYCPEENQFLTVGSYNGYSYYRAILGKGTSVTLYRSGSSLMIHSGYFWFRGGEWFYTESGVSGSSVEITEGNTGYHLGIDHKYVGYNKTNSSITLDSEANVAWQFIDADKATHYAAEKALYDALVATDGRGWMRDQYEQVYNNRANATNLELNQAADALNKALNFDLWVILRGGTCRNPL